MNVFSELNGTVPMWDQLGDIQKALGARAAERFLLDFRLKEVERVVGIVEQFAPTKSPYYVYHIPYGNFDHEECIKKLIPYGWILTGSWGLRGRYKGRNITDWNDSAHWAFQRFTKQFSNIRTDNVTNAIVYVRAGEIIAFQNEKQAHDTIERFKLDL